MEETEHFLMQMLKFTILTLLSMVLYNLSVIVYVRDLHNFVYVLCTYCIVYTSMYIQNVQIYTIWNLHVYSETVNCDLV